MMSDLDRQNPYVSPEKGTGRVSLGGGTFKDRRTALAVFGVFEILLGLFSLALAIFFPALQAVGARVNGGEPRYAEVVPSMLVYGFLGAILIGLGVGSIRCRRWARNLILVVSWTWLVSGILTVLAIAWFLPRVLDTMAGSGELPDGAAAFLTAFVLGLLGVFFVILPAVLVAFYRSGSVKATCEAIDPGPDWTELSPLPVLTLSLWLFVTAFFMLVAPVTAKGTIPVFGFLLTGAPGYLVYWAVAALWGYGAWGMYKLRPGSYWLVTTSTILFSVSYLVSFSRIDPIAMYELMGYTEEQLAVMKQMAMFTGPQFTVWVLLVSVPYVAYLLYLKKYFPACH